MLHHFRFALALGAILLFNLSPCAHAEAPKVPTQVPAYYRIQLGQFEITALQDGFTEHDVQVLQNINETDRGHLLSRMFVDNPKMQTSVNAYLINTGTNLVLVDAGAAKMARPTLGYVLQNMKDAGYDPSQVDTVIITHMHSDHIGGLNDAGGEPLFPKATILVPQTESDFWLSQKNAENAPANIQPNFKKAHDTAAPYLASGQWKTFKEGTVLVPGIQAVKAHGHTPGHTAYAVESKGQKLLIWGDLVHAHSVQFARPDVAMEFDVNQKQAIATRKSFMKKMAASKTLVAGMHLPFPGIGHVRAEGKGYAWVPIEYAPMPKVEIKEEKKGKEGKK
jgi:glyoxylase-like metal-dependent hydrolase (beta-lactamase superfamily II)